MATVTEWQLVISRMGGASDGSFMDATTVLGEMPFWHLSDGMWATYWYSTESEALAAAAYVALAGWKVVVTPHELDDEDTDLQARRSEAVNK